MPKPIDPNHSFIVPLILIATTLPFFTATIVDPVARITAIILGLITIPATAPLAISALTNLTRLQDKTATPLATHIKDFTNALARNVFSLAYATVVLDIALLLALKSTYFVQALPKTPGTTEEAILAGVAALFFLGPFDTVKRWIIIAEPISILLLAGYIPMDIFGIAVWQNIFATIAIIFVTLTLARTQMQTLDAFLADLDDVEDDTARDATNTVLNPSINRKNISLKSR